MWTTIEQSSLISSDTKISWSNTVKHAHCAGIISPSIGAFGQKVTGNIQGHMSWTPFQFHLFGCHLFTLFGFAWAAGQRRFLENQWARRAYTVYARHAVHQLTCSCGGVSSGCVEDCIILVLYTIQQLSVHSGAAFVLIKLLVVVGTWWCYY